MSYTVCNSVTRSVSHDVMNAVRTSVQNQNQNQRFWLKVSCGLLPFQFHPSNGDLGLLPGPVRLAAAGAHGPRMDELAKRAGVIA